MDARAEIFQSIQNDPELKFLKRYDQDWIYDSLSKICKAEKLQVNYENMNKFVGLLESDLESMFSGQTGIEEGFEVDL